MPPPLPDRYRLELRLGRDRDIEAWLATDTALDRPVLVRVLGPETTEERRLEFLDAVRGAAAVTHIHLAAVYAAAEVTDGAYSVTEWTGGVTMEDRLLAGEPMSLEEFSVNAPGLAGALAALHDEGVLHGDVDTSALLFSKAHPAKLGAFGRPPVAHSEAEDVAALADALETSLTGAPAGSTPPSQLIDGASPHIDTALEAARNGTITARELAAMLAALPTDRPQQDKHRWTWGWLAPAFLLVLLAVGLTALGLMLSSSPSSPVLFPARPPENTTTSLFSGLTTSTSTTTTLAGRPAPAIHTVASYDPFGDGYEHDKELPRLTDEDPTTVWRTERYFDRLSLLKPGVGITFAVQGVPARVEVERIDDGVAWSLLWAPEIPPDFDGWERIAGGVVSGGSVSVQLPERSGGVWLFWLTDLPPQNDGFQASIGEVRFLP